MQGNDETIHPFSKANLGFFFKNDQQFLGSPHNKDKKILCSRSTVLKNLKSQKNIPEA